MRKFRRPSPALLAVVLVATAGCGTGSYRLAGKVTFDGKPVPAGRIFFDADARGQNTGASGFADIVDGAYDTSSTGKGVSGGATVVRIQGFHKEGADDSGFGPPLFGEYTTRVDLPRESSTLDFAVPASAGQSAPKIIAPLDQGPTPGRAGT